MWNKVEGVAKTFLYSKGPLVDDHTLYYSDRVVHLLFRMTPKGNHDNNDYGDDVDGDGKDSDDYDDDDDSDDDDDDDAAAANDDDDSDGDGDDSVRIVLQRLYWAIDRNSIYHPPQYKANLAQSTSPLRRLYVKLSPICDLLVDSKRCYSSKYDTTSLMKSS